MNKTKKRGKRKSNKNKNKSRKRTGPVKGGRVMGAKMHILPRFVPNTENKNNEMKAIVIPIYDNNPIMSGIKDTNDWIAYAFNQYPVIPAGVKVQTQTLEARYKKEDEVKKEVATNLAKKVVDDAITQGTKNTTSKKGQGVAE